MHAANAKAITNLTIARHLSMNMAHQSDVQTAKRVIDICLREVAQFVINDQMNSGTYNPEEIKGQRDFFGLNEDGTLKP